MIIMMKVQGRALLVMKLYKWQLLLWDLNPLKSLNFLFTQKGLYSGRPPKIVSLAVTDRRKMPIPL